MMSTVTRPVVADRVTGLRDLAHQPTPLASVLGTVSAALAVSALVLVTTADGWGLPAAHEVPVDAADHSDRRRATGTTAPRTPRTTTTIVSQAMSK